MQAQHTQAELFSINPMKRYKITFTATLLLFLLGAVSLYAQPVIFSVNMEHTFLKAGDKVVVRGSIPGLGNWEAPGQLTLKKESDSSVYSAKLKLTGETVSQILYKFVIVRQDGSEEWEERGNRVLDQQSTSAVWFDDRSSAGIQQTLVQVTVRLDLTQHSMDGVQAEGVALMGGRSSLSYELETGRREMSEVSEGIWETTVVFPFGTQHDVPFKFAWKHEGEWMWEWRAGHTNHVFWIDDSSNEQTISLRYDPEKPGVVPIETSSGNIDDYEAIMAQLGEKASNSRYMYERAMELLEAGNTQAATAKYAQYKAGHQGGEEVDDFHYRMATRLSKEQGVEVAQAYIKDRLAEERVPERRAYYGYLEGEILMNAGRRGEARGHFRKVQQGNQWDIATEYSQKALAHSYLLETEPDSIKKGIRLLEAQTALASQGKQRGNTEQLARAYQRAGMNEEYEQTMAQLATTGNATQQAKGRLQLAESYYRSGKYTEALGLIDAAELSGIPKGYELRHTRLRIQAYAELEMYDELLVLFNNYEKAWPDDPYYKRLQKLADRASKHSKGSLPEPGFVTTLNDSTGNN